MLHYLRLSLRVKGTGLIERCVLECTGWDVLRVYRVWLANWLVFQVVPSILLTGFMTYDGSVWVVDS